MQTWLKPGYMPYLVGTGLVATTAAIYILAKRRWDFTMQSVYVLFILWKSETEACTKPQS